LQKSKILKKINNEGWTYRGQSVIQKAHLAFFLITMKGLYKPM